jgi:RNA polymerase sigma-70 factor (ECF subfamily)
MNATSEFDLGRGILEHASALRRYARYIARSADHADDLVQECMERALTRPHLYRPDTNLRAWLFTILRNIAITQARKAKLRHAYAEERMATSPTATPPSQFNHVALKESFRLMRTLPAGERQAVLLLSVYEMSYAEAARHARIEIGTVKSRSSRGRERLRNLAEPVLAAA